MAVCEYNNLFQQNNTLIRKYNLLFHHTFYPSWIWNANHSCFAAVVCNTFKIHYKLYQDCKHLYISAYICIENQYCSAKVFEKYYNYLSSSTGWLLLWFPFMIFFMFLQYEKIYGPSLLILLVGRKIVHQVN